MKSKQAILMAKMGKGNPSVKAEMGEMPSATTVDIEPSPIATTKSGGSLGILKSVKAGNIGGKMPSAMMGELPVETTHDLEANPVPKAYSPIKNYLKKGK